MAKTSFFVAILIVVISAVATKNCPRKNTSLSKRMIDYEKRSAAENQSKLLRFSGESSTANYVIVKPDMSDVQQEFSVCTWIRTLKDIERFSEISWLSYAVSDDGADDGDVDGDDDGDDESDDGNAILLDVQGEDLKVGSEWYHSLMSYEMKITRGVWHHLCFTWKSGDADYYIDGIDMEISNLTEPDGDVIPTGGTLVLGAEQYEPELVRSSDLFAGDMYQLNVFKKKLSEEEMCGIYNNGRCAELSAARKDDVVLNWDQIVSEGERKGSVTEEENECSASGGN